MKTLLFDIDGTLLSTGNAGMKAIAATIEAMFGPCPIPTVTYHGRTDCAIVGDLMEQIGKSAEDYLVSFYQAYWQTLPAFMANSDGRLLPGVLDLLQLLSNRSDIAVGLLTGNAAEAARIKLQHFAIDPFFHFGGFGDHHRCRNEVARIALDAAADFVGQNFNSNDVWVIGDTVNDIVCARSIEAKVVVVETGGAQPEELAAANPDYQLPSLEAEPFLELLKSDR